MECHAFLAFLCPALSPSVSQWAILLTHARLVMSLDGTCETQTPDSLMKITSVLGQEEQPLRGVEFPSLLFTVGSQHGYRAPALIHSFGVIYFLGLVSAFLRLYLIPSVYPCLCMNPSSLPHPSLCLPLA